MRALLLCYFASVPGRRLRARRILHRQRRPPGARNIPMAAPIATSPARDNAKDPSAASAAAATPIQPVGSVERSRPSERSRAEPKRDTEKKPAPATSRKKSVPERETAEPPKPPTPAPAPVVEESNHRCHSLRSNRRKPRSHSARRGPSFSPENMKTVSPPCSRWATTTIPTSR